MNAFFTAIIGILGTIAGSISTHILHYVNRRSEERKIINESIHYLLEVFYLVNRMNTEKLFKAYLDFYYHEIQMLIPTLDDKTIEIAKTQNQSILKCLIIPTLQKKSYEELKKLNADYESMLSKLATVLPINAFYLRGKNNSLENIMQFLSEYFKSIESITEDVKEFINLMKPTIDETIIKEYTDDLKEELLALLEKTDCYNCRIGKEAVNGIESKIITEEDKRFIKSYVAEIIQTIVK